MIKGIGCDIVQNQRVKLKLAKKILTPNELVNFEAIKNEQNKIEYIASRFAAKEAVIKATNKCYTLLEIEITNGANGEPIVNIPNILLTISHERDYSVAYAILIQD